MYDGGCVKVRKKNSAVFPENSRFKKKKDSVVFQKKQPVTPAPSYLLENRNSDLMT